MSRYLISKTKFKLIIPFKIPHNGAFSDKELEDFCLANPDLGVERDENGQLFINMSPTYAFISELNSEIIAELIIWNRKHKLGKIFESSSAFYLPDSSLKGPDAAFITNQKWESLTNAQKKSFPYLVPDFIIELQSENYNKADLEKKMLKWVENGVKLAWLIDTKEKVTHVYKQSGFLETVSFEEILSGNDVLPHFKVIWSTIFQF
jgi:Uma2 family endonuclease